MKVRIYINNLCKTFKLDVAYTTWLLRFFRFQVAYRDGLIPDSDLKKFQLFLLQSGQFNANFSLEEIEFLKYPKSPFAVMTENNYLRSTDTWSMEIASYLYRQEPLNSRFFPIWIDSFFLVREIERYYGPLSTIENYDLSCVSSIFDRFYNNETQNLDVVAWFHIKKPLNESLQQHKAYINDHFSERIKKFILSKIAQHKGLSPETFCLFYAVHQNTLTAEENRLQQSVLNELDTMFPTVRQDLQQRLERALQRIDAAVGEATVTTKDLIILFKILRPRLMKKSFPEMSDFKQLYEENKPLFKSTLQEIREEIETEISENLRALITPDNYREKISTWVETELLLIYRKIDGNMIFFFEDNYNNVKSLSLLFCEEIPTPVSSMLTNLGYRVDPVKITRSLLGLFRYLFVDLEITQEFWRCLQETTLAKNTTPAEENDISRLLKAMERIILDLDEEKVVLKKTLDPNNFCFSRNLSKIEEMLESSPQDYFFIFFYYLREYLASYQRLNRDLHGLRCVVEREINLCLKSVIQGAQESDINKIVKYTQQIIEIMNVDFEDKCLSLSIDTLIRSKFLPSFPVTQVMLTPYAMRAFVRVFQMFGEQYTQPKITATSQGYYELLSNLDRLGNHKARVEMIQTLLDATEDTDILFTELHPNNIMASQQVRHSIELLISNMARWSHKKRILVIDMTLNMLTDDETTLFLSRLLPLISKKELTVILIQSLTKFCQAGLDMRSAGLVVVLSCRKDSACDQLVSTLTREESIDRSTEKFFNFFMAIPTRLDDYVNAINKNCRSLYEKTLVKVNFLNLGSHIRCQLVVSSDPGPCYVGFSLRKWFAEVDSTLSLTVSDLEEFLEDLMKQVLFPLCRAHELPITARVSIGFPITSVNIVIDTLRLTIGLEDDEQLEIYSEILSYIIMVLNFQRNIAIIFFDREVRKQYFSEKVAHYVAWKIKKDMVLLFDTFPVEDRYACTLTENINVMIGFQTLYATRTDNWNRLTVTLTHQNNVWKFKKLPDNLQLMLIACLSSIPSCLNIDFHISEYQLTLISPRDPETNSVCLYGPYKDNERGDIYFGLGENSEAQGLYFFSRDHTDKWLNYTGFDAIFISQSFLLHKGNIFTRFCDIPYEEIKYFISEGSYRPGNIREFPYGNNKDKLLPIAKHCIPKKREQEQMRCEYTQNIVIIQRDVVCYHNSEMTIYKRYIDDNMTAVEIDYWSEKDPLMVRFINLIIAIFLKENHNVSFIMRDHCFKQILFQMSYENTDNFISSSAQRVLENKVPLANILEQNQNSEPTSPLQRYAFFSVEQTNLVWPSGKEGIGSIENKALIEESMRILTPMSPP